MILGSDTTLIEDLETWLRWHLIEPTHKNVLQFKKDLEIASLEGKSILKELDLAILKLKTSEMSKIKRATGSGRNYFRERVRRLMLAGKSETESEKKVQDIELSKVLKSKRNKKEADFDFKSKLEKESLPIWASIAIATRNEIFFAENIGEAAFWLQIKMNYSNIQSAKVTIRRSATNDWHVKNKFQAFYINQSIQNSTQKSIMKSELTKTEKAIEKLSKKLEAIAIELAKMNSNLQAINQPIKKEENGK